MICILNNIKFGNPKLSKYQLSYFDDFIQLINNKKITEIFIYGDLFYSSNSITFDLLSKVLDIFEHMSKIPIYIFENYYCLSAIKPYVKVNKDIINDKIKDISLFQHNKNENYKIGYLLMKDGKTAFVENKITPKFIQYEINDIEDLNNIEITKDFIDLIINSDAINNQQNKNIVDLFSNNNPNINIYYTELINNENEIKMDHNNMNIRNILIDNVELDLREELHEVFSIYDKEN